MLVVVVVGEIIDAATLMVHLVVAVIVVVVILMPMPCECDGDANRLRETICRRRWRCPCCSSRGRMRREQVISCCNITIIMIISVVRSKSGSPAGASALIEG